VMLADLSDVPRPQAPSNGWAQRGCRAPPLVMDPTIPATLRKLPSDSRIQGHLPRPALAGQWYGARRTRARRR
jgi:hypothetical protein